MSARMQTKVTSDKYIQTNSDLIEKKHDNENSTYHTYITKWQSSWLWEIRVIIGKLYFCRKLLLSTSLIAMQSSWWFWCVERSCNFDVYRTNNAGDINAWNERRISADNFVMQYVRWPTQKSRVSDSSPTRYKIIF